MVKFLYADFNPMTTVFGLAKKKQLLNALVIIWSLASIFNIIWIGCVGIGRYTSIVN